MNAVQPEAVQWVPRVRAQCTVVHTVVCLGQLAGRRCSSPSQRLGTITPDGQIPYGFAPLLDYGVGVTSVDLVRGFGAVFGCERRGRGSGVGRDHGGMAPG